MKRLIIVISFLVLISACNEEKKITTTQTTYIAQSFPTAVPEPSTILLLLQSVTIGICEIVKITVCKIRNNFFQGVKSVKGTTAAKGSLCVELLYNYHV
jgi:hypothetical protein